MNKSELIIRNVGLSRPPMGVKAKLVELEYLGNEDEERAIKELAQLAKDHFEDKAMEMMFGGKVVRETRE